jgi:transcriptional regulator with XRE-family HTH domain
MPLVENIKSLCLNENTSLPKLEKELGFGNGAIYNWDKNSPSISKVLKVANHFGVSVDSLIGNKREA